LPGPQADAAASHTPSRTDEVNARGHGRSG